MNEAYLRLTGLRAADFQNRVHFFGAAAQAMRRILVDHARRHRAVEARRRRPPGRSRRGLVVGIDIRTDLVALDEALDEAGRVAPQARRKSSSCAVSAASPFEEAAKFLDVAPVTVKRHWSFARAWLYRALTNPGDQPKT